LILHDLEIVRKAHELDPMAKSPAGDRLGILPDDCAIDRKGAAGEPEPETEDGARRQIFRE
jgi:hypothetical protein